MFAFFCGSGRQLQQHVQQMADDLHQLRGDLTNRLQQVEQECAGMRLGRMLRVIHEAAELAIRQGLPAALAIGQGLRAVITPFPPGKAGGPHGHARLGAMPMERSCPNQRSSRLIDKSTSATRQAGALGPRGRFERPTVLSYAASRVR